MRGAKITLTQKEADMKYRVVGWTSYDDESVEGSGSSIGFAEQNAIIQAAALGESIDGGTIYITHHPCSICAKMIINAGIKRIVIRNWKVKPGMI